jgi:2-dehydropantoate 2-reductase
VAETWVLCRRDEQARAIAEHGLRVTGKADFTATVAATTDPAQLPPVDLAIVATKATELDPAAAHLEGLLPGAAVMPVQNGLGAEEIVRRHGNWPLLSAVTFMSGTRHSDTEVEYVLDTETWLGPYEGAPVELAEDTAEALVSSGLKARAFADLRPAQWSKLIFNATVNGVAALTGLPHNRQFAEGKLGELVHGLVDEGKSVAAAAGIPLHDDPWEMNVIATQRGSAHYPSMLEDVTARRPTEVELINGAVVREARRLGVAVPLHETIYALVKARERSYS